ncbi:MAG: pilus assembly protein TadG-related protein, partial [Acidimicrobiia bacterium]|nr:pilus assembly protein TadG-related protein [Acidimicrobiia bacterium]
MLKRLRSERGASAILVAGSLIMLMGVAAIAVDAGAGFNLRRESQNSADLAALAAATNGMNEGLAVQEALRVARANIGTTYSNAAW